MKTQKTRYARLSVQRQGDCQTAVALRNAGGYFVHIAPDGHRHRKQKLVMRLPGKSEIALNGRQIASLRRVLDQTAVNA